MALQTRYGTPQPPALPAAPRPQVIRPAWTGTDTTPAYGSTGTDLGGGTGTWANPGYAADSNTGTSATWATP